MFISERELLFQQGHFDAQIAESERAARERFREQRPRKITGYQAIIAQLASLPRPLSDEEIAAGRAAHAKGAKPAPAPIAKAASPRPAPSPLSASERAAAIVARRQAAAREAERQVIAEQTAAVQRQARIDASWRRAHARATGRPVADSKPAQGANAENYGWGKAHATVAKRYGRKAAK